MERSEAGQFSFAVARRRIYVRSNWGQTGRIVLAEHSS